VFQRGPDQVQDGAVLTLDQIPVTPTQLLKVAMHLEREQRLKRLREIWHTGTNSDVLRVEELGADRIEGTPVKKVAVTRFAGATFVFTDKDGNETPDPAIPTSAAREAAQQEGLLLAGQLVVPNGRR
jgi:hypothetical protein